MKGVRIGNCVCSNDDIDCGECPLRYFDCKDAHEKRGLTLFQIWELISGEVYSKDIELEKLMYKKLFKKKK